MGRCRCAWLAAWLCAAMLHTGAGAASAPPSSDLPDLAAVRARIYSGEYASAVVELTALTETVQHAEVYNLRQLSRNDEAAGWYREALAFDPTHRPALEYQGELFIAMGDLAAARANLRMLQLVCGPVGCEEIGLLWRALQAAQASGKQQTP